MKKDDYKTRVKFLIERPGDEHLEHPKTVFAYFPDEIGDSNGNYTSYAHIGQHSACSEEYADECKQATPEQYKDLKAELGSIGYNLEILNK